MAIASPIPWVIGSHLYVALNGATLSDAGNVIKPAGDASTPTVVGVNAKPSVNDTTWVKLGHVAEVAFNTDGGTKIEIWEPATGRIVLNEIIRVARMTEMKVKARQVQPLTIQLALNTALLNAASTQFNPHAGPTPNPLRTSPGGRQPRNARSVSGRGSGLIGPLLQITPHQMAAGALQAHEQSMVGLGAAVAGFQVVLHLRQQMRGHLGIGQGPVGAT